MKILQRTKRALPPLPQVAELINKLSNTPDEDLHEVLGKVDAWTWPRSDLNAWIKVLNKFDAILEDVIRDYDVDKLQVNVFTPSTKKTVCEILRFERLLLENSTNRKTFSSYDRINGLLSSSDLDVVVLALNLLLRPAQQYSAQPAVSRALSISTPRLQSLAKRWPNLREYGVSLVDLVAPKGKESVEALPAEAREVHFTFYKRDTSAPSKDGDASREMDVDAPDVPQTPRKGSTSASTGLSATHASGVVKLHVDVHTLESKPTMDVLADLTDAFNVPEEERFELMCRIRSAQVLLPGRDEDREKLVIIRLLANAIFVHTHSEHQALSSLFLYEPDLISHISELLALDSGVPVTVQTAAVAALDAMARYRTKVQDVLAAVNAGVNHGTLMALLRKTVADVASSESTLPQSFVDALLSFVTFLASHAAGGNMVVGAGLVPLLIQILENRLANRLPVVSKAMQLVDNVLYSFANAFQLFCNNRGVDVLVDRIEYEVDYDIAEFGGLEPVQEVPRSYGQLPVVRAAALKHILRSTHRMMQSSGTSEGLRGLIDSSLLKSIKKIIEHRSLFGPSVLPLAINIMACFVHNEPTSLSIIQEANLPEAFYKAVEAGLEPVIEVIQSIPNALGALCLNQAGQDQLEARPTIIPGLFSIFTSERHQRVLQDKENAVLIGTAVDELIRHHPFLKAAVFEAIKSTLSKIEELGNAYLVPDGIKSWYSLVPSSPPAVSADGDVVMGESLTTAVAAEASASNDALNSEEVVEKSHENIIISYIDVHCRFLEGLFQHAPHCKDFMSRSDGLERLGRLTELPCVPYDFANSVASDSLVQVIRTMVDADRHGTLTFLAKLVKVSLGETKEFWNGVKQESQLLSLLNLTAESTDAANSTFRKLVTLHIRVTLLSDIYATAGYSHARSSTGLLLTLMGRGSPDIMLDLGSLHRVCIWENVLLKSAFPTKSSELKSAFSISPLLGSPSRTSTILPEGDAATATNGAQQGLTASTDDAAVTQEGTGIDGAREDNGKALRHIANQIPAALSPFFQAVVKLFSTRRTPDPPQRHQIVESAAVVAEVMLKHVEFNEFDDKLSSSSYYTFMLGLVTTLLVDERTAQKTLHTVLLDAFFRKGGLNAVIENVRRFMSTVHEVSLTPTEHRSETAQQELVHAFGGIKVALHLLLPLVSPKPIFDSSQTIILVTRDKKDGDPDYFEVHNFLVQLRLVVFPVARDLWEASWLVSAPQGLIRSVVQVTLEIVNGESEEGHGDEAGPPTIPGGPGFLRSALPDENRVRQLTDMGFPRASVERALMRTHNNVNAATELLLANPFRFAAAIQAPPPGPAEEQTNEVPPEVPVPVQGVVPAQEDVLAQEEVPAQEEVLAQAEATEAHTIPVDTPTVQQEPVPDSITTTLPPAEVENQEEEQPIVKASELLRKELDVLREEVKPNLGALALRLVDEHHALIFDIHGAFVGRPDGYQQDSIRLLVDDIKRFAPDAAGSREQHLAVRCRLLALVLNESPSSFTSVVAGSEVDFMAILLGLIQSEHIANGADASTVHKWLAALLLVAEALLVLGEEPRSITLPKEGEPIQSERLLEGPPYTEARPVLFDVALGILRLTNLPRDELLASLRLLVLLTRDHEISLEFIKRDGVPLLFQCLRSSTGGVAGSQSYITIILRHIVEDPAVVRFIMRQELQRLFSLPRTRVTDVQNYVRHCSSMALRDPETFVEVTQSLCELDRPYSSAYHLHLKPTSPAESKPESTKEVSTEASFSLNLPPASPPESLETVVHFLLAELMKAVKVPGGHSLDVSREHHATGSNDHQKQPVSSTEGKKDSVPSSDATIDTPYCGFLMQCLTELLFSYDICKVAFLSYSPKKRAVTPKDSSSRHRMVALHFLLYDLITYGTISEPTGEAHKRVILCNWAMSLIVALCVETSSAPDLKDVSPELISVRKFVLEAVNRAIKDLAPSDTMDARYGRLLALSDLCNRLLTVRFNTVVRKSQITEEGPTHIAKIMLEKNFVSTLTNALADVDLNFPNVRGVVAAILKPLEVLSKIAIKMSRTSGKGKHAVEGKEDMEDSELSEEEEPDDDDDDETDREETPDLYRNSSLGMFSGEMEEHMEEDEMDEDEVDDDDDVDMEFGDEISEHTSDTEEEDGGDEDEDLENESGSEEEAWRDVDEEDEDLVENEDEPVVDGDDDGDEDGDENPGWEGVEVGQIPPHIVDSPEDEDEIAGDIPIYQEADEDDEDDIGSDEDLGAELGIVDGHDGGPTIPGDVFGFQNEMPDGIPDFLESHPAGVIFSRGPRGVRRLDGDEDEIFGRSRAPVPAADIVTHPLLLESASGSSHVPTGQGRGVRRSQRGIFPGDGQDFIHAIEDIIGGGAVHLFQHIFSRRDGAAPEAVRLDVPAGALVNLERGLLGRRTGPVSASIRIERAPRAGEIRPESRQFDPQITLQRWLEEGKILHGKFSADRFLKVPNHIILTMLPAAIEKAKEAKVLEQEAAERAEAETRAAEVAAAEKKQQEDAERAAREEQEAIARQAAEASAAAELVNGPPTIVADDDTEMADATAEVLPESLHLEVQTASEPTIANQAVPGTSAAPERVTVMIHGSPVDITDTGIDPTFLEALPDDMREEVLNQHVRDQRAARVERPADSQISSEFLDALPPEIRAEILQQERIEQARRRAEESAEVQATDPGTAAEIDPASFIASLDPQLRQDVLMEQDEGFIQTLPSHMIAEAGIYRERTPRRVTARYPGGRADAASAPSVRKPPPPRDAIQLLDKGGIAVLIRLLFFPQISKKSSLFKVLVNLCENSKTRTELFNLLLNILQDGTGDLASVDRSFAQMTFRNSKGPTQTPKSAGKQKAGSDFFSSSLPMSHLPSEVVPDLIAQRCLEALTFIVSSNELSSLFFLTEHEVPASFRKIVSRKGKGKEKQAPQTQYPIVLLLSLLDRESLLKTPSILESVVSLLDTVTRPLTSLKDTQQKAGEPSASVSTISAPASAPAPASATSGLAIPPGETIVLAAPEPSAEADAAPEPPKDAVTLTGETMEEKILLAHPPQISHSVLRLIVNILTVGECGAKPFHHSLSLIQHLSYIPDAREVIAQELRAKTQDFGHSLYQDLDELANALQGSEGDVLASSVASKFSSPSSDQAKLLRVLKTIDYMYSPKAATTSETEKSDDTEKIQSIYESFRFTSLWKRLGDCLSIIEQRPEIEHIATVLLPLIESLMVVCKYVGSSSTGTAARILRAASSPKSPTSARESMEDLFVTFTDAHRKVLNVMVRNNPSLMSGSFSLLVHNPRVLDFDNKRNYFNQQLRRRPHTREHHGTLQLNVRRQRLFEDSFQYFHRRTGEQIKYGKLSVRFYDEEGVDAGGVTREWFQILARQMFDPNNALFEPCAADRLTYQPNKASWVNPEHLSFFKFVGRVIGKAIYDGRLLDAYFARSLYRQILGKPVDYKDVEWIDPEYYKSLCWILENDPSLLDLTFSVEGDEFGVTKIVDLKENGASIPVTMANRREFVQLSAQYRLYSSIKEQLEHLLSGFYEIIPKDLVAIFNEQELELLISGTPDIDVDEWRAATDYNGYTSSDPVIVWWWRALKSFNRDERAKVLSFATGTSRVPLSGFGDLQGVQGVQRFSIHRAYGDSDRLPQAHTCFNQIDLPQYSSYEMLRQQLLLAINEGGEGFGFA